MIYMFVFSLCPQLSERGLPVTHPTTDEAQPQDRCHLMSIRATIAVINVSNLLF